MKRFYLYLTMIVLLFINFIDSTFAQKYTISGYVEDKQSGEKLYSANIYDLNTYIGTSTNEYGFYSLTLSRSTLKLTASFIGLSSQVFEFYLDKDTVINFSLDGNLELQEFVVTDSKSEQLVKNSQMSVIDLPIKQMKSLPVLMGEADVLKTIQLLPGVQSGTEGTSGIYVRGGGPDQNLFLLDGVPVYNTSHLFGMFSVFNSDALSSVKLIKGGFPAQYGGRLSSVVDIKMKEGNMREYHGEGSVGLIATKFAFEGPIIKDKTSFLFSARRTYFDLLTLPLWAVYKNVEEVDKLYAGYHFFDGNVKINHIFNERNRLFLSFYMGNDVAKLKYKDEYFYGNSYENDIYQEIRSTEIMNFKLNWGNITGALRWNYVFSNKLFSNTTLVYSNYKFNPRIEYEDASYVQPVDTLIYLDSYKFSYLSGIEDLGAKIDFDYHPAPKHLIKFGANYLFHIFKPGVSIIKLKAQDTASNYRFGNENIHASEFFAYIQDSWDIAKFLKANIGFHYSGFLVNKKYYQSIQPRVTVNFILDNRMSIKASYANMYQYIHLLTNTTIGMPTDLWLPTTDSVKPQNAHQVALGWNYNIDDNWDVSVEGFYKYMNNLLEYKEGASFMSQKTDWESKVLQGIGWSYGAEIMLRRNYGKISGWVGYTLSWAWRQFDDINFGEKFPYRYDRRHDISVVVNYKINDRIDLGATWIFGTGNAVTLSSQIYDILENDDNHETIPYYGNRNGYRMRSYHRLDLCANFSKEKSWGKRIWTVGVYNAYNRMNPFVVVPYYKVNDKGKEIFGLMQYTLFPMIPYFSYSFKF